MICDPGNVSEFTIMSFLELFAQKETWLLQQAGSCPENGTMTSKCQEAANKWEPIRNHCTLSLDLCMKKDRCPGPAPANGNNHPTPFPAQVCAHGRRGPYILMEDPLGHFLLREMNQPCVRLRMCVCGDRI